jgi:hypothetical protein
MSRNAKVITTVLLAVLVLLLLGFWVGAVETFGGYVSRQRAFLWASVGFGLAVAVLLNRRWKIHFALAGALFLLSHVPYVLGQALGQTFYYVGATGAGSFMSTFLAALSNQL